MIFIKTFKIFNEWQKIKIDCRSMSKFEIDSIFCVVKNSLKYSKM